MAKYAVADTCNLRAVHFAERIMDGVAEEDIENGVFGYYEKLADGESVIYKFEKGTKEGCDPVMVKNPEWRPDESRMINQRRDQFINLAGVPFRMFHLEKGDEFGISIEGISEDTQSVVLGVSDFAATPVYLTIGADGKLAASTSKSEGDVVMEAQIMRKRMVGANVVTPLREVGGGYVMYEAKINVLA